jgi:hypothetical protein
MAFEIDYHKAHKEHREGLMDDLVLPKAFAE